jgi:pimeloyl-ACP methyl ester carboxylesterase
MHRLKPPEDAWIDWGGSGPRAVFGHANGFPPETYRVLLETLCGRFSVSSFAARPLWPGSDPQTAGSWYDLAADLGGELDRRGVTGAIGIGHSLGSVLSLLAAAENPDRYRALALVDPVVFAGFHALTWGAFKGLGLGNRLPLIQGASRRRDTFSDLEEVRRSWRGKPVFKSWDPRVLEDYIGSGFCADDSGMVTLRYPKAWEVKIFELTPAWVWRDLEGLRLPVLFVRGADSDTFLPSAVARARRRVQDVMVVEVEGTSHFLPMERPTDVADIILDWADTTGI